MKACFIIQDCVFEDFGAARNTLESMGVSWVDASSSDWTGMARDGGYVFIPHVSLPVMRRLERSRVFLPSFTDDGRFSASSWLTGWGEMCLNDGVFMTLGMARRRSREWFLREFGTRVFIRPDSGRKPFPGQDLPTETIYDALDLLSATYRLNDDILVLLSPGERIVSERRYFVGENGIVSGTPYSHPGEEPGPHFDAEDLILGAIEKWNPVGSMVVDAALLETGDIRLVEANCFSTSGLYGATLRAVFEHGLRVAREEFDLQAG